MDDSNRGTSQILYDWRGLFPSVDCCRYTDDDDDIEKILTYKHSSDIVGELLGDDREGGGEEGSVTHRLHDADDEAQRYEGHVAFHFIQHPVKIG